MATTTSKKAESGKSTEKPKPIVYERDDDDDGEREYSEGTKDLHRFFDGVVNSVDKLSEAVASGVSTYRRKHHESARKKEDGAVRDVLENVSEGFSEYLDVAADAPREFTKKVSFTRLTRLVTPIPLNIFLKR